MLRGAGRRVRRKVGLQQGAGEMVGWCWSGDGGDSVVTVGDEFVTIGAADQRSTTEDQTREASLADRCSSCLWV